MQSARISALDIRARKGGIKLTMVTAYDAAFARALDGAGVDMLLVGDSLGMVVQGHADTLAVRLEHMIYHGAAVSRVARRAHVVVDLPFMSYQVNIEQAVVSAGRLVQEGGAQSVKLEGGADFAATVRAIERAGIPVMGHIGLTPQRLHALGGFKVQGRDAAAARQLQSDALALQEAGAFALVLEGMPADVAAEIGQRLTIPTIGIGAGAACDGQVLVCYDLLGLSGASVPKFVKRYDDLAARVQAAAGQFVAEVQAGHFPAAEHTYRGAALSVVRPPYGAVRSVT